MLKTCSRDVSAFKHISYSLENVKVLSRATWRREINTSQSVIIQIAATHQGWQLGTACPGLAGPDWPLCVRRPTAFQNHWPASQLERLSSSYNVILGFNNWKVGGAQNSCLRVASWNALTLIESFISELLFSRQPWTQTYTRILIQIGFEKLSFCSEGTRVRGSKRNLFCPEMVNTCVETCRGERRPFVVQLTNSIILKDAAHARGGSFLI